MTDDERFAELYKIHVESISKYVYYLLALTAAGIAYSIDITKDSKFSKIEFFLVGLSVLCWGISFLFGCKYLLNNIDVIRLNMTELYNKNNALPTNKEEFDNKARRGSKIYLKQSYSFILGMVLFFIWYIFHLYTNTIPSDNYFPIPGK